MSYLERIFNSFYNARLELNNDYDVVIASKNIAILKSILLSSSAEIDYATVQYMQHLGGKPSKENITYYLTKDAAINNTTYYETFKLDESYSNVHNSTIGKIKSFNEFLKSKEIDSDKLNETIFNAEFEYNLIKVKAEYLGEMYDPLLSLALTAVNSINEELTSRTLIACCAFELSSVINEKASKKIAVAAGGAALFNVIKQVNDLKSLVHKFSSQLPNKQKNMHAIAKIRRARAANDIHALVDIIAGTLSFQLSGNLRHMEPVHKKL